MYFECVEDYALDASSDELHCSPEEFIIDLEERLENGEITIDEAVAYIMDLNSKR